MKNITQHTGPFELVERLSNSYNGNPRFRIRIDGFTCTTTPDSSHGYEVQNLRDGDIVTAHIGTHYGTQQLDALWPCATLDEVENARTREFRKKLTDDGATLDEVTRLWTSIHKTLAEVLTAADDIDNLKKRLTPDT